MKSDNGRGQDEKHVSVDRGCPVIKGLESSRERVKFKVKGVYHPFAFAVLGAVVCGQYCVEETLDCSEDVPLILKLGKDSPTT